MSNTTCGKLGIDCSGLGSVSSYSLVSAIITSSSCLGFLVGGGGGDTFCAGQAIATIKGFQKCFGVIQTVSTKPSCLLEALSGGLLNMTGICVFWKVSRGPISGSPP
jgi:hypothetical protein